MRGRRGKDCAIDLGLAILARRTQWLQDNQFDDDTIAYFRTFAAMALYCGCSNYAIQLIYERALRKIRVALRFRDPETWKELERILKMLFTIDREPACPNGHQRHRILR